MLSTVIKYYAVHSSHPLLLICNLGLQESESWLPLPTTYLFIYSILINICIVLSELLASTLVRNNFMPTRVQLWVFLIFSSHFKHTQIDHAICCSVIIGYKVKFDGWLPCAQCNNILSHNTLFFLFLLNGMPSEQYLEIPLLYLNIFKCTYEIITAASSSSLQPHFKFQPGIKLKLRLKWVLLSLLCCLEEDGSR